MASTDFLVLCNRQAFLGSPRQKAAPVIPALLRQSGPGKPVPRRNSLLAFVRLVILGVGTLALLAFLQDQPDPAKQEKQHEIYQDFRGNQPLLSVFQFAGPDIDTAIKPENAGLRITLSPTRPRNNPVHVMANFSLVGDFEITGTYELLSVTRPSKGYGSGVSISVATTRERRKFTKVGRLRHPQDKYLAQKTKTGNVYTMEFGPGSKAGNREQQGSS